MVTHFRPSTEPAVLCVTTDQDVDVRLNDGQMFQTFLRGGESLTLDDVTGVSAVIVQARERTAEVTMVIAHSRELSAVDRLAALARDA